MEKKRISRAEYFINSALLVSLRSGCERMAVGAVIVADNRIIATGYNGPAKGLSCKIGQCNPQETCTHAIHAEANAIYFSAKMGIPLKDTIIYCTHSPCKKCAEAIIQAGIVRVYYLKEYRSIEGSELLKAANIDCIQIEEPKVKIIANEEQL